MTWSVGGGPRHAGRVELGPDEVELTATMPAAAPVRIRFSTIRAVVLDRRVLRVHSDDAPDVEISSVDRPGALRELAERVSGRSVAGNP